MLRSCCPSPQARFLLAKLNPSSTHVSEDQFSTSGELIYTDDVSLRVCRLGRDYGQVQY